MAATIHANARTTPKIRAEIQAAPPSVSNAALARRFGVTKATVAKWRRRDQVHDGSHRPHRLNTTLTEAQEAVVVAVRELLLLPLDDLLVVAWEFLNPNLSRSALDRCLRRHGVNNLKAMLREQEGEAASDKPYKSFKDYEPGFVHVDIKYLPQMAGESARSYLFVAIDRATRWVYLEIRKDKSARSARAFLNKLIQAAPFKIQKILTDNDKAFTDRFSAAGERKPTGTHPFDVLCQAHGIEHRLIKPRRPQTNGMVERFNGRIAEILQTTRFDSSKDLKQTLLNYREVYNHHIPQRALGHVTPIQALKQWQQKRPEIFVKKVYNHAGLDIYTAIILALGMLVDNAVVVLENIERHLGELKEDLHTAIEQGTREVLSPVFAGTIATIIIMFPLMFVGDFPQHIFRPLISTLIIALLVSYFLSITFIPKLSVYLYRKGTGKTTVERGFEQLYQVTVGRLVGPYVGILRFSQGGHSMLRKSLLTLGVLAVLVVSLKNIMPLIGKDTMPPMDTGIIKGHVVFSANDRVEDAERKLKPFLEWLHKQPEVVMSSVAFGSEAGVLSLGSGNLPSEATFTVNMVNRFERNRSIWEVENAIRDRLHQLPGIKAADVFDFGATPLSSIKAPIDVHIKAGDYQHLPKVAAQVRQALAPVPGLTSITQSWDSGFTEIALDIDTNKALSYGLTPAAIAQQIPIRGQVLALSGNLASMGTQYVRLYL